MGVKQGPGQGWDAWGPDDVATMGLSPASPPAVDGEVEA